MAYWGRGACHIRDFVGATPTLTVLPARHDLWRPVAFCLPSTPVNCVDQASVPFHLPERLLRVLQVPHMDVSPLSARHERPAQLRRVGSDFPAKDHL